MMVRSNAQVRWLPGGGSSINVVFLRVVEVVDAALTLLSVGLAAPLGGGGGGSAGVGKGRGHKYVLLILWPARGHSAAGGISLPPPPAAGGPSFPLWWCRDGGGTVVAPQDAGIWQRLVVILNAGDTLGWTDGLHHSCGQEGEDNHYWWLDSLPTWLLSRQFNTLNNQLRRQWSKDKELIPHFQPQIKYQRTKCTNNFAKKNLPWTTKWYKASVMIIALWCFISIHLRSKHKFLHCQGNDVLDIISVVLKIEKK